MLILTCYIIVKNIITYIIYSRMYLFIDVNCVSEIRGSFRMDRRKRR